MFFLSVILQKNNFLPFSKKTLCDHKGQSFFEFILLMLVLILLSFSLLKGSSYAITQLWKAYIIIISVPTDDYSQINF